MGVGAAAYPVIGFPVVNAATCGSAAGTANVKLAHSGPQLAWLVESVAVARDCSARGVTTCTPPPMGCKAARPTSPATDEVTTFPVKDADATPLLNNSMLPSAELAGTPVITVADRKSTRLN